jgi:aspartyl-tRNA synthetase
LSFVRPNRYRTHTCGELRLRDAGKKVSLSGWVETNRDLGGVIFIDLRDRYGLTQAVFDPVRSGKELHDLAAGLRGEWVVRIEGLVRPRPKDTANLKLPTGEVEVDGTGLEVLNKARTPPIEIRDDLDANDDIRLQYRYLDLRRNKMQQVLALRHRAAQIVRRQLAELEFTEIETPFMVKHTPGGARNFLVPARLNPGKFYALAESPQLFKQLLMVAGADRYFQIVRCFRDEDLRVDRQPEFTQVDVELSFAEQDDVFEVIERLLAALLKELKGVSLPLPLERMPYDEALRRFGNDKPDRRFGLEHADLTALVREHDGGGLKMLKSAVDSGGIVKALRLPAQYELPRAQVDKLEEFVKGMGAKGLAWGRLDADGGWGASPLAKSLSPKLRLAVNAACGAQVNDLLFLQFGRPALVHTVLANLRLHLGRKFGLIPAFGSAGRWDCFWVVDPPLFDWDAEEKRWVAAHHAFTRPQDESLPFLESDPGRVKCWRYDLVLNGFEIAGGSIRIHDPEMQKRVFKVLGIGAEEAAAKFGFLLDAFQYGAPPHGGIALGWDRLVWLLAEIEAMRDVVAFPKNQKGVDMMTGAPAGVDERLLRDLGLRVVSPDEGKKT